MPEIIHGIDRRPLTTGKTLFDYADEVSLAVPQSCSRSGRCRECAVEVRQGGEQLSARTEAEEYLPQDFRLACQATVESAEGDVEFAVIRRKMHILEEAGEPITEVDPVVTTTDNREANILVGQKIPLITQDVAGNAVTRLETIGIRMIVTPEVASPASTARARLINCFCPTESSMPPSPTSSLGTLPEMVERFGLMPPQDITETEARAVAEYLFQMHAFEEVTS